jgi:hypothetical protein
LAELNEAKKKADEKAHQLEAAELKAKKEAEE